MPKPKGPLPARILVIGDFALPHDIEKGEVFSGPYGYAFDKMLAEAGILPSECFFFNVFDELSDPLFEKRLAPGMPARHGTPITKAFDQQINRLLAFIERCDPYLTVVLGEAGLFALTGHKSILKWRGSQLQYADSPRKLIPTYSPKAVLQQWELRGTVVQDLRKVREGSLSREYVVPNYNFVIRPTVGQILQTLSDLTIRATVAQKLIVAVDIETRSGHMSCFGFAWSELDALCIPLMRKGDSSGFWTLEHEAVIVHALYKFFQNPLIEIVGQNFLYDAQYIHRWWHFKLIAKRDTMITQHALFNTARKGLDYLASIYTQHYCYWKDESKNWDPMIGEEQLWTYNCKDAVATWEVDQTLRSVTTRMGMQSVVDFQNSLFEPVLDTMLKGLRVDLADRAAVAEEINAALTARKQWLASVVGRELNVSSSVQMKAFFYEELGQKPVLKRTPLGFRPSCDDESLQKIAKREPLLKQIVDCITQMRSLRVFAQTYIAAPLDTDSRMRCTFNPAGTTTYRFSSSENAFGSGMDLQNVSSGTADSKAAFQLPNLRKIFSPDEGKIYFDIDLNAADLRIVVAESQETELQAMLDEGLDPYTEIAKEFYKDRTITKKDPRRQKFKSFAHGTHYLGTAKGLADKLGLLVHESEQTQKWYFGRFPRIKLWQTEFIESARSRGFIQNVFGYRYYIFQRWEGTIANELIAWVPQSTVACLINRAYVKIHKTLPAVDILLQVHDSLAGQFPADLQHTLPAEIVAASNISLPYKTPIVIPVGLKQSVLSWGDCA